MPTSIVIDRRGIARFADRCPSRLVRTEPDVIIEVVPNIYLNAAA